MIIENKSYSENEILKGIARKDSGVLNFLCKENFRAIRHLVVSNSGSEEDAKDIFQETLVVLFRKINEESLRLTSSLNTYLYSIARFIWLKELERRKKRSEYSDNGDVFFDPEQEIIEGIIYNERINLFRDKFESLSDDCKKVLKMFLEKMPIAEITKVMGYSSEQHTKNRRFRCKKSLIERIRKSGKYKELGNEKYTDD